MQRLDRTYSTSYNFKNQKKEIEHYANYTKEQIFEVFAYLNSVAYNYPLNNPPRMDKTFFSCR